MRLITAIVTAAGLLAIAACQSAQPAPSMPTAPLPTLAQRPTVSPTAGLPSPTFSPAPTALLTPTLAPTSSVSPVSSPLDGVALSDLPQIVSNPFAAPQPGHDDGHHGTDFAFYRWGDRVGMLGTPVLSVFDGQVAAVVANRPPYGNLVIVETVWEALPPGVQGLLSAPLPPKPDPRAITLSCPGFLPFTGGPSGHPSLYLLYAHLKDAPALRIGDRLASGGQIGLVGTTGFSVNPHLHLETRAGPPGAVLPTLAHYIASATQSEMEGYCTWRVSGIFAMFDPVRVLSAAQAH
jgi:murein DD-endopeptidase MepM/ murein hydrolase activator NlpD